MHRCIPTAESLYAGRAKAVRQLFGQIFRTFALKPALRVFSNCLDWFASVFSSVVGDEGSAVAILNPSVLRKLNIRAGQRLKPAGDGATLCNFFRSGLPFLAVLLAGCDAACQLPDATPVSELFCRKLEINSNVVAGSVLVFIVVCHLLRVCAC